MQVNYGKVFRIGRLDDDYKFIAEPIQTTPLEPEMKAVYYDTREREPMDQVYYVAGIMDQSSPTSWNVALGYFSTEEMIPMQAYFGAEMARQRED
jgi:hypothetical protein